MYLCLYMYLYLYLYGAPDTGLEIFFLSIYAAVHLCRTFLIILLPVARDSSDIAVVVYLFFMAHNDGGIADDGASFDWFKPERF